MALIKNRSDSVIIILILVTEQVSYWTNWVCERTVQHST